MFCIFEIMTEKKMKVILKNTPKLFDGRNFLCFFSCIIFLLITKIVKSSNDFDSKFELIFSEIHSTHVSNCQGN